MKKKNNFNYNYICTTESCNYKSIKWLGCCPECQSWNSLEEFTDKPEENINLNISLDNIKTLDNILSKPIERMVTQNKEWDRVMGGGLVPGGFCILTGDPGIGKSTLLLQVAHKLSESYNTIYFSSEESLEQVKLRADRLNCINNKLLFSDQANLDNIIAIIKQQNKNNLDNKIKIAIIDSIQNCYLEHTQSAPGSISQLKEAAFKLMRLAKEENITVILTGHITKDGIMAGPKTLEHMVDSVFYLQGEDRWQTRILRSVKNRFGPAHELGFFQMGTKGLEEMPNINEYLLQEISENPGSVLISFIEGSRPLLIELQALVLTSKYGIPQRVVSGIDQTQVVLVAAILEKYLKVKFSAHDIFFKISGSLKIKSSSADLGIALALLSSYFQKPLPPKSLALGEISLTGQIKPINSLAVHTIEAERFGITSLLLAKNQKISTKTKCNKLSFKNIHDLLKVFE